MNSRIIPSVVGRVWSAGIETAECVSIQERTYLSRNKPTGMYSLLDNYCENVACEIRGLHWAFQDSGNEYWPRDNPCFRNNSTEDCITPGNSSQVIPYRSVSSPEPAPGDPDSQPSSTDVTSLPKPTAPLSSWAYLADTTYSGSVTSISPAVIPEAKCLLEIRMPIRQHGRERTEHNSHAETTAWVAFYPVTLYSMNPRAPPRRNQSANNTATLPQAIRKHRPILPSRCVSCDYIFFTQTRQTPPLPIHTQ